MSDLHRARARAEAFAHAVDHGPRHSTRLGDDPELLEAVELVGRLRTAGAVAPRPEFSAELRHRLLEQAAARAATTATPLTVHTAPDDSDDPPGSEDVGASVTDIRRRQGRRRIRLVASTAALVLLGGGIGSAAAAQQAMPGDTLYGMKRSIENVATNVGVGDDSRGRRDLEHAMTRLSEVRELAQNGGSVGTINATLDDFSAQSRKGVSRLVASYQQNGDESSITAITAFITSARQALVGLAPKLPPESLKSGVEALATIEQLAQHTAAACPKCAAPKPDAGTPSTGTNTNNQPGRTTPGTGTEPSDPVQASTSTSPKASATTAPTPVGSSTQQPTTAPTKLPNTTIVEESTAPPPTILKTPPVPSSSNSPTATPTVLPSLTPSATPSWPWPFPPATPIINLPGIIQTLFPPWK